MRHSAILLALAWLPAKAQIPDDSTAISMQDVVVASSRQQTDVRYLPLSVKVIDKQELTKKNQPSIVPTLAEQVPGLFVTTRGMMGYGLSGGGAGGFNIRGLGGGSGRMLVLVDGHPQYAGVYGHPTADAYVTSMVERVEVLRGPSCLIYGSNAMGGIINIVTGGRQADGVHTDVNLGAGSYGTFQGSVSNALRHKGLASNVAAVYNRSDNHRPNMGFEQYGGHVNLSYDICSHWHSFADADISHFNASHPGTEDVPMLEADQWITRGIVNAGIENSYDRTSGAITGYSNFGRHKINDGYEANGGQPQTSLFRSKDALSGLSLYQSVKLCEGNSVTVGFDWKHTFGHAYYTDRKTGEVLPAQYKNSAEETMDELGAYANVHQKLCRWLSLDAGVRYDHHSVVGGEWIPQGGLVLCPTSTSELKAIAGKGFRFPVLREMYLYPSSTEELEPERIMNYELAWHHKLAGGRLQYSLNIYYLKGDNLIQTVNRKNVNTGEIENWGAEAEAFWRISGNWQLSTNHSLLHTESTIVGAPKYKGYLGADYTEGRWSASLGLLQFCGLYTSLDSNAKQEDATLLSLSLGYHATRFMQLWARGENLLAQQYETNAGYPMPRATFMGGVNLHF